MKINKENFSELKLENKISEIVNYNKQKFIDSGKVDTNIYFFDSKNNLFYITIDEEKLITKDSYKFVVKRVIKRVIEEIEYLHSTKIRSVLYFIFKEINPKQKNYINLDIKKLDSFDTIDSFIAVLEDEFYINLNIYDCIIGRDEIKNYYLLSENPINTINHCKLDPSQKLKGSLINLL